MLFTCSYKKNHIHNTGFGQLSAFVFKLLTIILTKLALIRYSGTEFITRDVILKHFKNQILLWPKTKNPEFNYFLLTHGFQDFYNICIKNRSISSFKTLLIYKKRFGNTGFELEKKKHKKKYFSQSL